MLFGAKMVQQKKKDEEILRATIMENSLIGEHVEHGALSTSVPPNYTVDEPRTHAVMSSAGNTENMEGGAPSTPVPPNYQASEPPATTCVAMSSAGNTDNVDSGAPSTPVPPNYQASEPLATTCVAMYSAGCDVVGVARAICI